MTRPAVGQNNGNIEFSVVLTSGTTVRSRAPVPPGVWTHVGGMYDGRFLRLFMNGEQVGQVLVEGTIRDVIAPLRIGATTQKQFFDGIIDEVWLSTNPTSPDRIAGLACIHRPFSVAVSPADPAPVPPDTPVDYSLAITNQDIGFCPSSSYFLGISNGGFGGGTVTGVTTGGSTGPIVLEGGAARPICRSTAPRDLPISSIKTRTAILAERHVVPEQFEGEPFLAGSVFNDLIAWTAPGVNNNEARHKFSLNTCNGCHGASETNTVFLQIAPRFTGSESVLSAFLTGTTAFDPVTGAPRTLNDLARRRTDLTGLVCGVETGTSGGSTGTTGDAGAVPIASGEAPVPTTSVRKGIGRTE